MRKKKQPQSVLRPGESLIWTGEPCANKDHGKIDRWLIPVSAVMVAFSTFFVVSLGFSVVRSGFRPAHLFAFVLFALVGGLSYYSYFFRFAVKRNAKADLAYGITSQGRVLICDHSTRRIYEFESKQLRQAKVTEVDKDGVGTIYLQPKRLRHLLDNTGLDFLAIGSGAHIAMFDVPECKMVYHLLRSRAK